MQYLDIEKLFNSRDKAVRKHDLALFRSTQLENANYSSPKGYLSLDDLVTKIISHYPKGDSIDKCVIVKETYKNHGNSRAVIGV